MKKTKKPVAAAPAVSEPEALKCARSYCDEPRWAGLLCRRHYEWIMGEAPATVTMLEVSEIEPREPYVPFVPRMPADTSLRLHVIAEEQAYGKPMALYVKLDDLALDQLARAIEKRIAAATKKDA